MKSHSLGRAASVAAFALASACYAGGGSRFSASPDHEALARRITSGVTNANLAIAELTRIEAEMANAITHRDKDFFDRLAAEEFLFTTADGTVGGKADFIAAFDRSSAVSSYEIDDLVAKASGGTGVGTGIVWGRSTITAETAGGEILQRQLRFTHVFRRTAGQWQIVAAHESPVRSDAGHASVIWPESSERWQKTPAQDSYHSAARNIAAHIQHHIGR